jgi:hypothetical protein
MTTPARPIEDAKDALLVEAYRALMTCACRAGSAYRTARHGLLDRIRETLDSEGISVPPVRPAYTFPASQDSPAGRPSLSLVKTAAPASCSVEDLTGCGFDEFAPTEGN